MANQELRAPRLSEYQAYLRANAHSDQESPLIEMMKAEAGEQASGFWRDFVGALPLVGPAQLVGRAFQVDVRGEMASGGEFLSQYASDLIEDWSKHRSIAPIADAAGETFEELSNSFFEVLLNLFESLYPTETIAIGQEVLGERSEAIARTTIAFSASLGMTTSEDIPEEQRGNFGGTVENFHEAVLRGLEGSLSGNSAYMNDVISEFNPMGEENPDIDKAESVAISVHQEIFPVLVEHFAASIIQNEGIEDPSPEVQAQAQAQAFELAKEAADIYSGVTLQFDENNREVYTPTIVNGQNTGIFLFIGDSFEAISELERGQRANFELPEIQEQSFALSEGLSGWVRTMAQQADTAVAAAAVEGADQGATPPTAEVVDAAAPVAQGSDAAAQTAKVKLYSDSVLDDILSRMTGTDRADFMTLRERATATGTRLQFQDLNGNGELEADEFKPQPLPISTELAARQQDIDSRDSWGMGS